MTTKLMNIYVYEPSDKAIFDDALDKAVSSKENPFKAVDNSQADIRDLKKVGQVYTGFLANLRTKNLPHLMKINDIQERELPKDEDEALGEKSHFLYSKKSGFFFFQMNGNAFRNPSNIAEIFTTKFGKTIVLNPKLTRDAEIRLINNQYTIYKLELNIAGVNPKLLGNTTLEQSIKFLSGISNKIKLVISNDKREGRFLDIPVKEIWSKMFKQGQPVSKFKVYSSELDEPIDLLLDRVKFTKQVQVNDGYVLSDSAYQELEKCRQEFSKDYD